MFQNHASVLQTFGEDFLFVFCYQDIFHERHKKNKNDFSTPVDIGDSNIVYKETEPGVFIPIIFFDRSCNVHYVTEYAGSDINHGFEVPTKLEYIGRIYNDFKEKISFIPDESIKTLIIGDKSHIKKISDAFQASLSSRSNSEYIGYEILLIEDFIKEGVLKNLEEHFK